VVLAGNLDLTLLTALAASCRLSVSCDSALMHIVSAFQRPQVSLFGPTNPFLWRPRHPFSRVVRAADPSCSANSFSPDAPTAPMNEIPSSALCREVDALIAQTTQPPPVPARDSEVDSPASKGSTPEPESFDANAQ
jgi:ADP-heptose:LPS heptosyltransferase